MNNDFTFYLGTHELNHINKTDVPLFISFRRLRKRIKKPFNQLGPISVDSGGFTELSMFGKWTISPKEYVDGLKHLQKLGLSIDWASQQDLMCEYPILKKTGLSIEQHQELTVQNLIQLRSLTHDIHFIPVLQGHSLEDYFNHFEMFEREGFDLRSERIVGVGSVCRRQNTAVIEMIMRSLHSKGLNLHGFGVKIRGLKRYKKYLKSSDSLAWSLDARYNPPCENCGSRGVKNCANCLDYALNWRQKIIGG